MGAGPGEATAAPKTLTSLATPTAAAPRQAAPLPGASSNGTAEVQKDGSGLILGIAPTEQQGRMLTSAPDQDRFALAEPQPAGLDWLWVQAGLAGLALACGLAAYLIWRRSRS
jgi:hypothetical protein